MQYNNLGDVSQYNTRLRRVVDQNKMSYSEEQSTLVHSRFTETQDVPRATEQHWLQNKTPENWSQFFHVRNSYKRQK